MKQGWEIKKLGDICSIQLGKTPYRKNPKFWDKEKLSGNVWLSISDLKHGEYISESAEQVTDLGAKEIVKIPKGTMLLSFKLTLGRVSFAGTDLYTNEAIAALLNLNKKISKDFLFYYFSLFDWDKAAEGDVKVKGKTLNKQKLKELQIPLPPLPEQQRIVSILDEAFAAIAKAKANAEQNLKNAKELFESYLQGVFENGNWGFVKLSEMATDISDGDHMPPPKSEFGLPFITISNINKQTHKIDFSDTFKVPQKYYDDLKPNKKPIKGDVLYTVTGSYGIPVLIEDNFQFCFQRHIGLIRPSKNLDSKLLYYWILSPQAISQANETATGTAQKTVSLKSLRNFSFPNIPLQAQQTIVRQLDALRSETQKLEALYQKKIEDLEELKKSILQKAFAGELRGGEPAEPKTEKALTR